MILRLENLKDSTKILLDLINKFSKVVGYKINIQKSVALLYTNNKLPEKEIKKMIPFTIASKPIKYLGINLTKKMKDRYSENNKTLMKLKKMQINGKVSCVHRLEELILLKCQYCQKPSTESMQFLSRFQWRFLEK